VAPAGATAAAAAAAPARADEMTDSTPGATGAESVRVASFNASLNRNAEGDLVADLATPDDAQARTVAEIVQRTAPDLLLVNEFDYVRFDAAADLFRLNYLERGQDTLGLGAAAPIEYPYVFVAPSNTGVASGFDFDNNGEVASAVGDRGYGEDALGFGLFPGQYGMAVFSKHPILYDQVRTFQTFLWKDMPGARLPDDPSTPEPADWYSAAELEVFRLPSKSFWDVPGAGGRRGRPPADGAPDAADLRRAGRPQRPAQRRRDPLGRGLRHARRGRLHLRRRRPPRRLAEGARFVVLGDMNADPFDGDSVDSAIRQLLDNPAVDDSLRPASAGGPEQSALQGRANAAHRGDPAFDTADFADTAPGNLRVDYALPSAEAWPRARRACSGRRWTTRCSRWSAPSIPRCPAASRVPTTVWSGSTSASREPTRSLWTNSHKEMAVGGRVGAGRRRCPGLGGLGRCLS
jgi:hypothetical protein